MRTEQEIRRAIQACDLTRKEFSEAGDIELATHVVAVADAFRWIIGEADEHFNTTMHETLKNLAMKNAYLPEPSS